VCFLFVTTTVFAQEPKQGGIFRVAAGAIIQLDQALASDGPSYEAMSNIHGYLYRMQNYGDPFPDLATSWEWVDDTTLVFYLREGVTFHDGNEVFPEGANREVTADDVVYSMERWLTIPGSTITSDVTSVFESIEALDTYTVQFNLSAPTGGWFHQIRGLSNLAIIPHEAVEFYGEDFGQNPIGAGPFEFVEYVPDDHLTLRANEDYFIDCYLDGVEYSIIPDASVALIALEAGDLDFIGGIPPAELSRIAADDNYQTYLTGSKTSRMIWFPSGVADWEDVRVRQAFSLALDSDSIGLAVYGPELTEVGTAGTTNAGLAGHIDGFTHTYDPDQARALLAEAGWTDSNGDGIVDKDGVNMEDVIINTFNIARMDQVLEIVLTQLREVGIPAVPELVEFGTWSEMYISGAEGSQVGERRLMLWVGCGGPGGLQQCWSTTGAFVNVMGYNDPDVFAWIDEANKTVQVADQDAILEQAQQRIFGESFWTINATPPIGTLQASAAYVMDYGVRAHYDNICTTNNNVWLDK
jgi:peptide/nickel transport system substrate-binding protein